MAVLRWRSYLPGQGYQRLSADGEWFDITDAEMMLLANRLVLWNPLPT